METAVCTLNKHSCKVSPKRLRISKEGMEKVRGEQAGEKELHYEYVGAEKNYSLGRRGIGSLRHKEKEKQGYPNDHSPVTLLQCRETLSQ